MGIWDIRLGRVCISMAVWLPVTMGVIADPVIIIIIIEGFISVLIITPLSLSQPGSVRIQPAGG